MQQLLGAPPHPQTQEHGKVKWKSSLKNKRNYLLKAITENKSLCSLKVR